MPTLLYGKHPAYRVLNPVTGEYAAFVGGKYETDESDPNYPWVMAEATRNPDIVVAVNVTQCPECGETFTGKAGKADLGKHRKAIHPIEWERDREAAHARETHALAKSREGFSCDVCVPLQTFPTTDELALHTRVMHGAGVNVQLGDGTSSLPDDLRERFGGASTPDPGTGPAVNGVNGGGTRVPTFEEAIAAGYTPEAAAQLAGLPGVPEGFQPADAGDSDTDPGT